MTRLPRLLAALAATALLSFALAAAAAADPRLGIELERTHEPLHLGDEKLVYEVTVKNEASDKPKVGDELTCSGGIGSGNPTPTPTYEWLRDGTPIAGATEKTYVAAAADEGKSIQCAVTSTNEPAGGPPDYGPVSAMAVSLPPVVVEPEPASAPPSGSTHPNLAAFPLMASTPSGTATSATGSAILTDVVSSEGTGTFTNGSPVVEGVTMGSGFFEAPQAVAGTCVAADATIQLVEEPSAGSGVLRVTLSTAATCSGPGTLEAGAQPFSIGQEISGECIPAGAKILAATNQGPFPSTVRGIEMDKAATCSKAEIAIAATATLICSEPAGWSAGSAIGWSFRWLRNGAPIAGATSDEYTVTAADTDPPAVLQCEARAEDGEGQAAVAVAVAKSTRPVPPSPYSFPNASSPKVGFENQTNGEVALEVELPVGEEIYAVRVLGSWSCTRTFPAPPVPARVSCARSDTLSPQDSYQPLTITAALGKNPPQPLITKAEVSGGGAPEAASAQDEYTIPLPRVPFGFKAFEVEVLDEFGADYTQAGGHPFSAGAMLEFNTHETPGLNPPHSEGLSGATRTVRTQTPPGFVGNPLATPEICPSISDVLREPQPSCPDGSVVGFISAESTDSVIQLIDSPIYALEPEEGTPAQFAFRVLHNAFVLTPELRAEDGYAIDLVSQPLPKHPEIGFTEVTLCGFGVNLGAKECRTASDPEATELPFLTNPTRCADGPPVTTIIADSWEGEVDSAEFESEELTNCHLVEFGPEISLKPTSNRADSPTGMDVTLTMPTAGLEEKEGIAQANLEGTTVTLPEGMAVNPATASGLGACSLEEIGMSAAGVPDEEPVACPQSSKVGTVEAKTPLLEETLTGNVYIARQGSNPFGSLLALYLVIDSPENGILIKLAGRVSPDPATGRLTVTFDDNPQAPIASVELHFAGGNRAALINPPLCGTYPVKSEFTPWTAVDPEDPAPGEIVTRTSSFQVSAGPGGGPCPSGGLEPRLRAGLANPQAGATTPFVLDLSREDGTQRFRSIAATTPPGLSAYLKGVPYCPESALASIPTAPGTGAAQLASPACPAASQVGTVIAGAGAGPDPLFLDTGRVYLTGPYKGAPLSLAIATPAVTGPFDLGNVVVRTALNVNPATAQITAVSDPIPTILEGIPLDVRDVRVNIDRPNFTLAPTNCSPLEVKAQVTGEKGAVANVSDRLQVGGCEKLGFKPSLKLRLKGKTKRGAYQRLIATLNARPGDANIASASVALPHSIFLAQEHIRTVCTRVQFAADQCPAGSIYGKATAISPLVDYPLEGTVYLRSSSNPLPDMVIAFKGPAHQPIEIELAGRVDSVNGGIRNSFDLVPDAPVTSFRLELRGGKKSLLVSSRNLCKGKQRASVKMDAQNGRERDFRPVVSNDCKGKGAKGKGKGR